MDERCRTIRDDGWRTERANHNSVESRSVERVSAGDLGPFVSDADTPLKATLAHRPLEELGTTLIGLQQDHGHRRELCGDCQAGQSSARAQIKEVDHVQAQLAPDQRGEPLGVAKMPFDRARTQEARLSSGHEHLGQARES